MCHTINERRQFTHRQERFLKIQTAAHRYFPYRCQHRSARSHRANRDTTARRCMENHFSKGPLRLHSLVEHRGCLRTLPFVKSKCKKLSTNRRRFLLPRADFHLVVSLVYTRDQLLNTHASAHTSPNVQIGYKMNYVFESDIRW